MLVSVIIPCFQQGIYLAETLDSVLNQTYSNWECIIVNDGSTDNTHPVASEYCNKDTRFQYLEQSNLAQSAARNNAIHASKGELILPLDADDIISPTYMEKAVEHFTDHPETKLVYCKAMQFGAINGPWNLPEYNYDSFIWINSIFCTAFFKRSDFDKTSGFNTEMHHGFEDWDFWLSLLDKYSIVYQIDEYLFHYRKKNQSMDSISHQHMREIYNTIYYNHKDIYEPYFQNIIEYHNSSLLFEEEAHNAILKVKSSKSYRLGYFILHPLYKLFTLFKNKQND